MSVRGRESGSQRLFSCVCEECFLLDNGVVGRAKEGRGTSTTGRFSFSVDCVDLKNLVKGNSLSILILCFLSIILYANIPQESS